MATYTTLRYGSTGDEVKKLQTALGFTGKDVDGIFGNKTLSAVKDYQTKNGLSVDGIVGKNTWGALNGGSTATTTTTAPAEDNSFKYKEFEYQDPNENELVKQANALLQQQMANKPGEYQSTWQTQLNDTLNQILNREKFSYDLNGDALYQQYKDQYTKQGQMAMMDTMGQAAAMTGGYGSSYAQSVGQQAYQSHLQQLNDKVPELYQLAREQYNQEGQELYNQASLMAQMDEQEYGRHRDSVSDYYTELDYLTGRADTEYNKAIADRDYALNLWADKQGYDYKLSRDAVTDKQWQMSFDEGVRQHNESLAASKAKSSSNDSGYDDDDDDDDDDDKIIDSVDFTGSTYKEAVNYMTSNGVPKGNAAGAMTESEWARRKASYKNSGTGSAEVTNYSSYKEYIQAFVKYQTQQNSK